MHPEQRRRVNLTAIHLDLTERTVSFQAGEETVGKVTLAPQGIIFEAFPTVDELPHLADEAEVVTGELVASEEATNQESRVEREGRVTLSGRLKTKPRAGKPDRRGNPTAWARFAAHVEGEDGPHLYSATFHRHTAKIALGLERDAALTVEGYAHPSRDPAGTRLDTLSVVNLVAYPGQGDGETEP